MTRFTGLWSWLNEVSRDGRFTLSDYAALRALARQGSGVGAVDTSPPTLPSDLTAVPGSSQGEADLTWTAATDNVGVVNYRIYDGGTLHTTVGNITSTTITGLSIASHTITVSAVDAAGNDSGQSNAAVVVIADIQAPTTPTGLTATAGGEGEMDLSWTASTDNVAVTGYRCYVDDVLTATVGAVTSTTLVGLSAGSKTFKVSAIDAAGNESAKSTGDTETVTGLTRVYWKNLEPTYAEPSFTGTRTFCTTITQAQTAINNAVAGDLIVLADGVYTTRLTCHSRNGSSGNPITIMSQSKHGAILQNTVGFGIRVTNSTWIDVMGFKTTGCGVAGIFVGNYGGGAGAEGPCTNLNISHVWTDNCPQEGIIVRGGRPNGSGATASTDNVNITWCKVSNTGTVGNFGEGIYLGYGSDPTHSEVDTCLIQYCDIQANNGEAIDVKCPSVNITIRDNDIHDVTLPFSGAITIHSDFVDFADGNVLIERNRIWNVNRSSTNAVGAIEVEHGTTTIRNNVIWDIEDYGITSQEKDGSAAGEAGFGSATNNAVIMYNNTIWETGLNDILMGRNDEASNQGVYTYDNNLTQDGSASQPTATASDFQGTDLTGQALGTYGGGPGSGFDLDSGSSHLNSATTIGSFSDDLFGDSRPVGAGWSEGAFER